MDNVKSSYEFRSVLVSSDTNSYGVGHLTPDNSVNTSFEFSGPTVWVGGDVACGHCGSGMYNDNATPSLREVEASAQPVCRFCACDGNFVQKGTNAVHRKGIWVGNVKNVCTRKFSMEHQNTKGSWYVCDTKQMTRCCFYEPKHDGQKGARTSKLDP